MKQLPPECRYHREALALFARQQLGGDIEVVQPELARIFVRSKAGVSVEIERHPVSMRDRARGGVLEQLVSQAAL